MKKIEEIKIQEIIVEPPHGWFQLRLRDLWEYRELAFYLTWRDISVRYKQTGLGVLWAVIQPVITMVIFSVIFGKLAKLPSDGIPYPIFSYTALLPWQLFSNGVNNATSSVVGNQNMITKTYFPRLILPISAVISGLMDFVIAFFILFGMMFYYHIDITWRLCVVPIFIILALLTSMAAGMWFSALNVKYRDIKYITPFLMQIWQYATPIAYSSSLIPSKWQALYNLNPMTGVMNGFRWAMLSQTINLGSMFYISVVAVLVFFIGGLIYFQRTEKNFADMV
jgi:lipopolysaccharide transport system permease protein